MFLPSSLGWLAFVLMLLWKYSWVKILCLSPNQGGVAAHPGSHCINFPHPVHLQERHTYTCQLTTPLIKQKLFLLLNHSPRAYIFLIFCVVNGELAQSASTTHSSKAVVVKKSIRLICFFWVAKRASCLYCGTLFFPCKEKKYIKKFKNLTNCVYSNLI